MACHNRIVVIIGKKRRSVPRKKSPRYVMRSMSETRRIFVYLRSVHRTRPASVCVMVGLVASASLLEDMGDHLVQRRILNAHVHDGVAVEDDAQHLRHPAA